MNEIKTLFDRIDIELDDLISDAQRFLYKNDKQYLKLSKRNSNIKEKYSKILNVYESNNPQSLNKKELDALITILNNDLLLKYMELKMMFMLGIKESYYYLKMMKILDKEDAKK